MNQQGCCPLISSRVARKAATRPGRQIAYESDRIIDDYFLLAGQRNRRDAGSSVANMRCSAEYTTRGSVCSAGSICRRCVTYDRDEGKLVSQTFFATFVSPAAAEFQSPFPDG